MVPFVPATEASDRTVPFWSVPENGGATDPTLGPMVDVSMAAD